jgi:hypothetical protein
LTIVLKKIEGRLAFIPPEGQSAREALKQLLTKCEEKHGGFVSLTFKVPYKKRTSGAHSQNSCIHGYATVIANATGHTVEEIKTIAKKRAFRRGYPIKKDDQGRPIYSKLTGEPIAASSAEINTIEAGYLIEELQQIAAELEIVLPRTIEEIENG